MVYAALMSTKCLQLCAVFGILSRTKDSDGNLIAEPPIDTLSINVRSERVPMNEQRKLSTLLRSLFPLLHHRLIPKLITDH